MIQLTATEIALQFNAVNELTTWKARPNSRPADGLDLVHFNSASGLITLIYNTVTGRFEIRFNKFQAAWGDYIKAIARTLYYVLTTLKSAGLPFEAPPSLEDIEIIASLGEGTAVYVSWRHPEAAPAT